MQLKQLKFQYVSPCLTCMYTKSLAYRQMLYHYSLVNRTLVLGQLLVPKHLTKNWRIAYSPVIHTNGDQSWEQKLSECQ